MDEQNINELEQDLIPEEEKEHYVPRPRYQIIMAWVGVVIVAVAFVLYCWRIAMGA